MDEERPPKYWLFQAHPSVFRLRDALRVGALNTFAVKAHKKKIKKGDKAILWQTGKEAGCYALATISGEVRETAALPSELPFYEQTPEFGLRVPLRIEYNIWNQPITPAMIEENPAFDNFHAGLPGTNYTATEKEYRALEEMAGELSLVQEPGMEYFPSPGQKPPLNLILYGPPGTGKTYQAVNYALSVIERRPLEELALENRQELRRRFNDYLRTGRAAYVTFHQSFSYEDFVEGIKPYTAEGQVKYRVEEGIFKMMCREAYRNLFQEVFFHTGEPPPVGFNKVYNAFLDYLKGDKFNYFEGFNQNRILLHRIHRYGDLSVRPATSYAPQVIQRKYLQYMYRHFKTPEQMEAEGTKLGNIIGERDPNAYWAVFSELKAFETDYLAGRDKEETDDAGEESMPYELPLLPEHVLAKCDNYVLVIDEINRGNIPAIFGELITLLEEDKREGAREAITTLLPYSKDVFSVPPNLYIIGTMNTTDRSTEALDIALRRRFAFRAMQAEPALISKLAKTPLAAGVNLAAMLTSINNRLELLIGGDYQIGHAYFLGIHDLDELKAVFERHIIPLLQEYFFNDYGKIGLVLGREFVREKESSQGTAAFADFDHPYAGEFSEKRVYELRPLEELDEASFILIYDKEYER